MHVRACVCVCARVCAIHNRMHDFTIRWLYCRAHNLSGCMHALPVTPQGPVYMFGVCWVILRSQIFVDQLFILVPGAACLDSPCVLRLYALVRTCTHLYALVRTCMRLYALVYSPCVLRLYALVRACINSPCVLRLYALVRDCIYSPCVLRLYAQPL